MNGPPIRARRQEVDPRVLYVTWMGLCYMCVEPTTLVWIAALLTGWIGWYLIWYWVWKLLLPRR